MSDNQVRARTIETKQKDGNGEWVAWLVETPTTMAYGETKMKAITNLLVVLHGDRDVGLK